MFPNSGSSGTGLSSILQSLFGIGQSQPQQQQQGATSQGGSQSPAIGGADQSNTNQLAQYLGYMNSMQQGQPMFVQPKPPQESFTGVSRPQQAAQPTVPDFNKSFMS